MKRYFCVFLALILSVTLCGCSKFYVYLEERIDPADTVVILTASTPSAFSDLDTTILDNHQSTLRYRRIASESAAVQYRTFEEAVKAPSTAAVVVELSSRVYAQAMVEAARERALPLVFCGRKPELSTMDLYENCWYVGFEPALASELQAKLVTDAYRADSLTDQSGDYKLNALTVTGIDSRPYLPDGYADTLLNNIELAGIHAVQAADPIFAAGADELYAKLDALLLPQQTTIDGTDTAVSTAPEAPLTHTEIIFCGDTDAATAVLQLLSALEAAAADEELSALATPFRSYYVACYGINAAVETAVKDGLLLGAVGRDTAASTNAILTLCENLARKEAITKNNDYHFVDGKYLMLDYRVISAGTEAEQ